MVAEVIPLAELPSTLLADAIASIAPYCVGLCQSGESTKSGMPQLFGSGTLVRVGKCHAILTAEHVVRELPTSGRLGLLLGPSRQDFTVDIQGLTYLRIARGKVDQTGPDLGAIVLSSTLYGAIGSKKLFWDLNRDREELLRIPPDRQTGFWFVNGFPDSERSNVPHEDGRGDVVRYLNLSGVGAPDEPTLDGEHDYYRFPVKPANLPDIPSSFGGMSGGGLWQFQIRRDKSGKLVIVPPLFSGVVFYQVRAANECALICHGRKSVYEVVYGALSTKLVSDTI